MTPEQINERGEISGSDLFNGQMRDQTAIVAAAHPLGSLSD